MLSHQKSNTQIGKTLLLVLNNQYCATSDGLTTLWLSLTEQINHFYKVNQWHLKALIGFIPNIPYFVADWNIT